MNSRQTGFTLIELLVVIAIIGILAGLLFPAVNGALDSARKAQAKNDVVQIATAITAYETEYGKLPVSGTSDVQQDVNSALVQTLIGITSSNNTRGIVFMEIGARPNALGQGKGGKSGTNSSGDFLDPWGYVYKIKMDGDYNNSLDVTVPKIRSSGTEDISLRKKVVVWNDPANNNRTVRSWE